MSTSYKIRNDFVVRSTNYDSLSNNAKSNSVTLKASIFTSVLVTALGFGLYNVLKKTDSKSAIDYINDINKITSPNAAISSLTFNPVIKTEKANGATPSATLLENSSFNASVEDVIDETYNNQIVSIKPLRPLTLDEESDFVDSNSIAKEDLEISFEVDKGDSLSSLFEAVGLSSKTAIKIASLEENKVLNRLKVGDALHLKINAEHQLEELSLKLNQVDTLVISQISEDEFTTTVDKKEIEWRTRTVSGQVQNSFGGAANKAGLNNAQVAELAGIYKWDMDFNLDVRRGDNFHVILEEGFVGDSKIRGKTKILAAEYDGAIVGRLTAIRHEYANGEISFYTPEGRGFQKAFLRAPLNYRRISSGFQPKRYHPILKKWRSHKGTDFAARRGEPVSSTASGKIIHIGRKGAYGKTIIVKHQDNITTLYAHLNGYKKGLKRGARVRQGEVIGYVGSTGLSTGPHLHYEFRKNNGQLDPMKVKLPRVTPIKGEELTKFKRNAANLLPQIAQLRDTPTSQVLAQNVN